MLDFFGEQLIIKQFHALFWNDKQCCTRLKTTLVNKTLSTDSIL